MSGGRLRMDFVGIFFGKRFLKSHSSLQAIKWIFPIRVLKQQEENQQEQSSSGERGLCFQTVPSEEPGQLHPASRSPSPLGPRRYLG